jgi:uncharacterized protein YodC (DUF2158 family)
VTEKDPYVTKALAKNPAFEVGDVVKLSSGGPSMTIREVSESEVHCEWFDKATVKSHSFLKSQLAHTTPDQLPILSINVGGKENENVPPWEREGR